MLRPLLHVAGRPVELIAVPVEFLPDGHGVGDPLEITFLADPNRRSALQREVKNLIDELVNNRANADLQVTEQSLAASVEIALRRLARQTTRGYVLQDLPKASETIAKAIWSKLNS